jgi:4-amino-4-deoxy-L-arabinose transferase-like glycosyltransferase
VKPRRASAAACALLLLLWGLLVTGGRALSISMDEPLDITSGYIFLARWLNGLWQLPYHIQPPLLNVVHAVLLFAAQPHIPLETLAGWGDNYVQFTAAFLPYLMPLERTEILARTPVMLLAVLLGALVFRWGKELAGREVGLLAVAILTFDPLFLAHSRFATTDLGATAMGTAALYATWRWLKQPSWKWTLITGGLMGIAVLTKYSAFTHAATFALMALASVFCRWKSEGRLRFLQAAVVGGMAFLFVWAVFGFQIGQSPMVSFSLPAPMYWTTFYDLWIGSGRRIFVAFGKTWVGPHWWYFPLNFVLKNPIPLLLGLLFSSVTLIRRRPPMRLGFLVLAVFPCLYTLTSISGGMNVSYRHMLPVHPFIYLFVAWGIGSWLRAPRPRWQRLAWGLLGLWYIFGTLRLFPDELTYFNELVGGPEKAHRYFVDYTQDWGQSNKELRAYLEAHPGPVPQIVYYTHIHPDLYGIRFHAISPSPGAEDRVSTFHPQPGRYVVGITPLYGLVGRDPLELEWFRRATPTAMVGHALFVYDVTEQPAWVAQCTTPDTPLDDAAIVQGFGLTGLRRADFDCTAAWLYPGGGSQMGVYALHHAMLPLRERCLVSTLPQCEPVAEDPFIRRHLSHARLSYEQRQDGLLPAFAAYELSGEDTLSLPAPRSVQAAPAETLPAPGETTVLTAPVHLDGPLTFLGIATSATDDTLEVETWWQVTEEPVTHPFSIMAHLLTAQGETLGVADGLGVHPMVLRAGDVLVQRHRFARPADGSELWLRTGAYWLDTMERWKVVGVPGADALFVSLGGER